MDLLRSMTCVALTALVATGCGEVNTGPTGPSGTAALGSADRELPVTAVPRAAAARNFVAPLDSDQEVPPVDSRATGLARFQLSADGNELSYRLNVANIRDVLMAHIHMAPRGENGGVVVWLYPSAPPPDLIPGRSDGTLATGTITAGDLVGSLAGEELSTLLEAMEAGNTYVNVHTSANPAGEIRGADPGGRPSLKTPWKGAPRGGSRVQSRRRLYRTILRRGRKRPQHSQTGRPS